MAMLPFLAARLSLLFAWATTQALLAAVVLAGLLNVPQLAVLIAVVAFYLRRRRAQA